MVLWSILIGLSVFLVHVISLQNGFHLDDHHSIQRNTHIQNFSLWQFLVNPETFSADPSYAMWRPAVVTSLALNFAIGGYSSPGYVAANLGIHALTSVVAFRLFVLFGIGLSGSILGALTFGLHPLNTEVINYINTRSESLCGLFYLTAFYGFLRAQLSRETPGTSDTNTWAWLSAFSFCLALLSKEIAVTLPFAILLYKWTTAGQQVSWVTLGGRKRVTNILPYFVILILYFIVRQLVIGNILGNFVRSWVSQFATQSKALMYYVVKVIFPMTLNITPQFAEAPDFWAITPIIAVPTIIGAIVVAVRFRNSAPTVAFSVLWFILLLSPTVLIPLNVLVNDHRTYLATTAFGLLVGWCLKRHSLRQAWAIGLMAFAVIGFTRDLEWRNDVILWTNAVEDAPLMPIAHYNLGFVYHQAGRTDEARMSYQRALELEPRHMLALNNLGAIYLSDENLDAAETTFETLINLEPESIEALNNLGRIKVTRGNYAEAVALYRRALAVDNQRAEVWLNLGLALRDMGNKKDAFDSLHRAIQLDPNVKKELLTPTTGRFYDPFAY